MGGKKGMIPFSYLSILYMMQIKLLNNCYHFLLKWGIAIGLYSYAKN